MAAAHNVACLPRLRHGHLGATARMTAIGSASVARHTIVLATTRLELPVAFTGWLRLTYI
jgi:hypothetical protein